MRPDNVKSVINRKIRNFIDSDKESFDEIIKKMKITASNFKKILEIDSDSKMTSVRKEMIERYLKFSEKRINDLEWAQDAIQNNEFFAGISDSDTFKLIQLRDKISYDVIDL